MTAIQNHPRFKKDNERYLQAIKDCKDDTLRLEIKSLYDQFLLLVKEIDSSFDLLVSEHLSNKTQQEEIKQKLSNVRSKLEEKLQK